MLSSMLGSDGDVIVSILLPFGSSLRVSIYRESNLLLVLPMSFT
jgi:hypothetical protein